MNIGNTIVLIAQLQLMEGLLDHLSVQFQLIDNR